MFKRILLFSISAAAASLMFSSYANGPFQGGAGNRTGSAGTTGNCSTGGCHSANSANTTLSVSLVDGSTPVTNGTYIPGHTYHVIVAGGTATAALPRFGFQLSTVRASNTSTQAGSFALAGATQIAIRTSGSLQLVEHTQAIPGTGSGNSWTYSKQFDWTAPVAGAGQVKFYLSLNAVNFNNSESGDQPNNNGGATVFNEGPTSVGDVEAIVAMTTYPNPVKDQMHIAINNASGTYNVVAYDMVGRTMYSGSISSAETTINTQSWTNGVYYVKVAKDGAEKVVAVVKQ